MCKGKGANQGGRTGEPEGERETETEKEREREGGRERERQRDGNRERDKRESWTISSFEEAYQTRHEGNKRWGFIIDLGHSFVLSFDGHQNGPKVMIGLSWGYRSVHLQSPRNENKAITRFHFMLFLEAQQLRFLEERTRFFDTLLDDKICSVGVH